MPRLAPVTNATAFPNAPPNFQHVYSTTITDLREEYDPPWLPKSNRTATINNTRLQPENPPFSFMPIAYAHVVYGMKKNPNNGHKRVSNAAAV